MLIRYFTLKYAKLMNREIEEVLSSSIEALTAYDWPGNVRELQNIIERSVILSSGRTLQVVLPETATSSAPLTAPVIEAAERERILRALLERAARSLDLPGLRPGWVCGAPHCNHG